MPNLTIHHILARAGRVSYPKLKRRRCASQNIEWRVQRALYARDEKEHGSLRAID